MYKRLLQYLEIKYHRNLGVVGDWYNNVKLQFMPIMTREGCNM